MNLEWSKTWKDIRETANDILPLCEARLKLLPPPQQQKSTEILIRLSQELSENLPYVTESPHFWGTQLANVGIRILRRMSLSNVDDRKIAKKIANFCGIVFQFRRDSKPENYENLFRDSVETFLEASLPDLVPTVIAADMIEEVRTWLKDFYDRVPSDFSFLMNDLILRAYESRRRQLDVGETRGLMIRFVEDNRDLISLEVSDTSEGTRENWEKLYREHVGEPPPPPQKHLLTPEIRASLKASVQQNEPMAVRDVLAPIEEELIKSVRNTLEVSFDFREPNRTVRDRSGKPSSEFEVARRQIRSNNKLAVTSFRRVWQEQRQNDYAKEWYAYARAKLEEGYQQAKPLFEDIRRADRADQITDWNLACCGILSNDRETAFRILQQRVELGCSLDVVLEPSIALALELKEKQFLSKYLDRLPKEEAILLGYLYAADTGVSSETLELWLPAIDVIASEKRAFDPPDPAERLSVRSLNDLCFAFIERRMLHGGINWFQQRVSFDEHKWFYLNWQLLADLNIQVRKFDEAARAYEQLLKCTSKSSAAVEVKQQTATDVLNTLLEHGLAQAASKLLVDFGTQMLSPSEVARWQQRIQPLLPPESSAEESTGGVAVTDLVRKPKSTLPTDTRERFNEVKDQLGRVRRIEDLEGDFSVLSEGTDCLFKLWPAYSRKLVEKMHSTIKTLEAFGGSLRLDEKERLGSELRDRMSEVNAALQDSGDEKLKKQAEILISVLSRLAADASFQTSAVRSITIDWRVNGYLPQKTLPPVDPRLSRTCVLLRVSNTGTDPVNNLKVNLESESERVLVAEPKQQVDQALNPGSSAVVRFPLDYDSLTGDQWFLAYAEFTSGGVANLKTPATRFCLRAESFSQKLGGEKSILDAFFVGVGIPEDRRDVFHGRDREHTRIADSLRRTVPSEVFFLNGPRRVGKTSILNSLQWALPERGLNDIITVALPEAIPQSTAAFLRGIASEISKGVDKHLSVNNYLQVPSSDEFEREPIGTFKSFCESTQTSLSPRRVLLMIDETQRLAQAVKDGRIDDNVLSLFSSLMSRASGVLVIFTASVLFRDIREMSDNPIWGRLVQFATGFLSSDAVEAVLRAGVTPYPVQFTPEAFSRVWQMTEGHPWVVQAIGKRIVNVVLNPQQRLVVGPSDVDQAVEYIEEYEDQYSVYWWNEVKNEGGFIDETDWELARVIIEGQESPGTGVLKTALFQRMIQLGKPITNERVQKLTDMQTLVKEVRNGAEIVRIKGLFLERWLKEHDKVTKRASLLGYSAPISPNVSLFVDHENVAISMEKFIKELPSTQQAGWQSVCDPFLLARRLAQNAERFGTVVPPRFAVANWQHFVKDISAYAQAMFEISQPLGGKNTSDERLKQLIRDSLEQNPDVGIYIIATGDSDFRDTIQTLLKRNKRVILWGFRSVGRLSSNVHSIFREMETWQNLTIEYLDDILLQDLPTKSATSGR